MISEKFGITQVPYFKLFPWGALQLDFSRICGPSSIFSEIILVGQAENSSRAASFRLQIIKSLLQNPYTNENRVLEPSLGCIEFD